MQLVLDEVTQAITDFYKRDDVSRQAPGRKDATTVKKTLRKYFVSVAVFHKSEIWNPDHQLIM